MRGAWIARRDITLKSETRPKPLLKRIAHTIKRIVQSELSGDVPLLAVTIGAPGMTDIKNGVVLEAANLDNWKDVPVRARLEDALGVEVAVDNDVNFAAIGEHWRGGAQAARDFVFITLGTGIGAGIIINNQIHRGAKWYAGEISHLNVDFREWNLDFKAAGYLESYLGDVPRTKTKSAVRRTSGGVFGQTKINDESLIRLGAGVANIVTILDPELIIFGGRIGVAHPEIAARVAEVANRIAPNCPPIRTTELGEDAPLYGGLRVGLNLASELLNKLLDAQDEKPQAA